MWSFAGGHCIDYLEVVIELKGIIVPEFMCARIVNMADITPVFILLGMILLNGQAAYAMN